MNSEQPKQRSLHINQEQLLAFVRAMMGGSGLVEDAMSQKRTVIDSGGPSLLNGNP